MAARTRFSVATCNLFNLNLPGQSMYSNTTGWTADQYARKLTWQAGLLQSVGADVWGFQELWHEDALREVFDTAGLSNAYQLITPPQHSGSYITCAGAVRGDLLVGEPEWITQFPDELVLQSTGDDPQTPEIAVRIDGFSRPVLRFRVRPRTNGQAISVYVVHLKSKVPAKIYYEQWYRDDSDLYKPHATGIGAAISTIRRTAEAAALRVILTKEMRDTDVPVIVLGDLNDGQHSNTLNIITGQPNYTLSGYYFSAGKAGSDVALYTIGMLQQYRSLRNVYYTHLYKDFQESLDHILASQEFYDNSHKRLWAFRCMKLANDHLDAENHKEQGSSDHAVVYAEFEYRPRK